VNYQNIHFIELIDGRCPKNILRYKTWSAEEWHKFAFPVAECVLSDLLPPKESHLVWLTARIVELLFHHRCGLTREEVVLVVVIFLEWF